MSEMTVKTNLVPRNMLYWDELSDKEKAEFDYMDKEDQETGNFVRYRGWVYDVGEFMRYGVEHKGIIWAGCEGDSYFSGTLIHLCKDNQDQVIMARFYC
jgi:hypothetical protein